MKKQHSGGWPRGKRRREKVKGRAATIKRLRAALEPPVRCVRTASVVAEDLGVCARTVRRWIDGTDWPDVQMLAMIDAWCDDPTARLRERVSEYGASGLADLATWLGVTRAGAWMLLRDELDKITIKEIRRWLRS